VLNVGGVAGVVGGKVVDADHAHARLDAREDGRRRARAVRNLVVGVVSLESRSRWA
jgi:hypothetical protein